MKGFTFPLTDRQRQMLESTAKILLIACGTKTGKTVACEIFLIKGLFAGEPCCYVGPYFFRSRQVFDEVKKLLQPWILQRFVQVNEARLQMSTRNGGRIDFISGDNEQTLFGQNYSRIVLDEATRMSERVYTAALTTVSATQGSLRLAFNLDLGQRNWCIRHLLRIQALSPEQRAQSGESFLTFPSGGDGLVSDETIAAFKTQMPLQLWEALYLAKIPTEDCSLFRNLDKIFTGHEREKPAEGVSYFLGIDLARKADFTACTVMDSDGNAVWAERFSQMDWSLQVGRCALLYRTYNCRKAIVDSTGLGDPVCEQMEDLGMEVERYTFSVPSRKSLIEELILSCDNCEITVPSTERFKIYRQEMEAFEYILDGSSIKYSAPSGMHDDTVMSLALAAHGVRAARGAVLGMVLLMQRQAKEIVAGIRDRFGELLHPKPKPKPLPQVVAKSAVIRSESPPKKANDPCPACKSTATILMSGGIGRLILHCNMCGCDDGKERPALVGQCCGNFLPQYVSGFTRCGNCGASNAAVIANGARFSDLQRSGGFGWRRAG